MPISQHFFLLYSGPLKFLSQSDSFVGRSLYDVILVNGSTVE
jgi:hypothetical protein